MEKNQKGFTVTETILIVILVILLGAVGYYVYSRQSTGEKDSSQTITKTTSKMGEESLDTDKGVASYEIPKGFTTYSDADVGFKFGYPSSWGKATNNAETSASYIVDFSTSGDYSVDLRANSSSVNHAATDSRYAKGFTKKGDDYYILGGYSGDEKVEEDRIVGVVKSGMGKVLIVRQPGFDNNIEAHINLPAGSNYAGLKLTFTGGFDYEPTERDIESIKKSSSTFQEI